MGITIFQHLNHWPLQPETNLQTETPVVRRVQPCRDLGGSLGIRWLEGQLPKQCGGKHHVEAG